MHTMHFSSSHWTQWLFVIVIPVIYVRNARVQTKQNHVGIIIKLKTNEKQSSNPHNLTVETIIGAMCSFIKYTVELNPKWISL